MTSELILLVVGVVGQIVFYIFKKWWDERSKAEPSDQPKEDDWLRQTKDRAILGEKRITLSLGLVLLATCCLLMINNVVRMQNVELHDAFLWGIAICGGIGLVAHWAWRKDCLFLVIAYWCGVTALTVTVSYWPWDLTLQRRVHVTGRVPLPSLFMLFLFGVASVTHFVGLPWRMSLKLKKLLVRPILRNAVICTAWPLLLSIPLMLVIIWGTHLYQTLATTPFVTRSNLNEDGARLLEEVSSHINDERRHGIQSRFFCAASEVILSEAYRKTYVTHLGGADDLRRRLSSAVERLDFQEYTRLKEMLKAPEMIPDVGPIPSPTTARPLTVWLNLAGFMQTYGESLLITRSQFVHPVSAHNVWPRLSVPPFEEVTFVTNVNLATLPSRSRARRARVFPDKDTTSVEQRYRHFFHARIAPYSLARIRQPDRSQRPLQEAFRAVPQPNVNVRDVLERQLDSSHEDDKAVAYYEYLLFGAEQFDSKYRDLLGSFWKLSDKERGVLTAYVVNHSSSSNRLDELNQVIQMLRGQKNGKESDVLANIRGMGGEEFTLLLTGDDALTKYKDFERLRSMFAKWDIIDQIKSGSVNASDVQLLFNVEASKFCNQLQTARVQGNEQTHTRFTTLLKDPVYFCWSYLLYDWSSLQSQEQRRSGEPHLLERFAALGPKEREAVVTETALQLYAPPNFATALRSLKYQLGRLYNVSPTFAWISYFVFSVLVCIPIIWLGVLLERLILLRDRLLMLMKLEHSGHEYGADAKVIEPAAPLRLFGRQEITSWLHEITQRGFGTVAVVGRRGVGKTRVLQAMLDKADRSDEPGDSSLEQRSDNDAPMTVGVWMSVPTTYSEKDFVIALHERLAESVEFAMSRRLRVLPLSSREHLAKLQWWELIAAAVLVNVFAVTAISVTRTSGIHQVQSAFVGPWLFVAFAAVSIILGMSQIPPVNLYRWFLRERASTDDETEAGLHCALLYRDALKYARIFRTPLISLRTDTALPARWLVGFVILWILLSSLGAIFFSAMSASLNVFVTMVLAAVSMVVGYAVKRQTGQGRHTLRSSSDSSVTSLVADYRQFAQSIVHRVGYLSGTTKRDQRVVVCLDELDKLIDTDETRTFLRRMKGLFEIEGVYYFISLAEDARKGLTAGSSLGKDEVDSAVDHIITVEPLAADDARQLMNQYYRRVSETTHDQEIDEPLGTFIVIASAAIPRDILRWVDRWVTSRNVMQKGDREYDELRFIAESLADEVDGYVQCDLLFRSGATKPTAQNGPHPVTLEQLRHHLDVRLSPEKNGVGYSNDASLRALIRLYVLTVVLECWDKSGRRFVWNESSPQLIEAFLDLSYRIPTEELSRLKELAKLVDEEVAGILDGKSPAAKSTAKQRTSRRTQSRSRKTSRKRTANKSIRRS